MRKREIQAAVILDEGAGSASADGESLTWSAAAKGREGWFKRLESGRSSLLLADRDRILGAVPIARHHRILAAAANDGLLLWESLRRAPEGLCAALVDTDAAREALLRFASSMDETEQPLIAVCPPGVLPAPAEAEELFACKDFDFIVGREPWRRINPGEEAFTAFAAAAAELLVPGGRVSLLQSPPRLGGRVSRVLEGEPSAVIEALKKAEEDFFSGGGADAARWNWDGATLGKSFAAKGFVTSIAVIDEKEERLLTTKDIQAWFDAARSPWGKHIAAALGEKDFSLIKNALVERAHAGPVLWQWKSLLFTGCYG
jgi:putative ATPase